jgi:NADP-dependent 3-hydroxy acid dehydrogenase YdfG
MNLILEYGMSLGKERHMSAEQPLVGKLVLITGASSGIGRATALAMAAEGANVIAVDRRAVELDTLAAETKKLTGNIVPQPGDVTDRAFIETLVKQSGAIDILVNVAGILRHTPFLEGDPDHWQRVFDTNVVALLRLTQAVAKGMAERRSGHIILMSSALARAVYPYTMVYAATKHAVRAIHNGLRQELNPFGIRSTEICPGLVGDTDLLDATDHPAVVESYKRRPYKAIKSVDIARAVIFAAKTPPGVEIDVIEVKPIGQA